MYNLNRREAQPVPPIREHVLDGEDPRRTTGSRSAAMRDLSHGGFIFGGITTERTATNDCDIRGDDIPTTLRFCEKTPPFRTLYKASARRDRSRATFR